MKEVLTLSKERFDRYGKILEFSLGKKEWEILVTEEKIGWRIALLEIERKEIKRLERHPDSMETFEPVSGIGLLFVADKDPGDFEVFILDRPVCLYKGIWHEVATLTEKAKFKITENYDVKCEYFDFEKPFVFKVIEG
jgi:ureidoglycolate hydrolase